MNRDDLKLDRLFAAARPAEPVPADEMPPYVATRVIAHWRAGALKDDSWQILVLVFRRALLCAAVVMLSTLAWSYDASDATPDNDEAYANYQLRADVMP